MSNTHLVKFVKIDGSFTYNHFWVWCILVEETDQPTPFRVCNPNALIISKNHVGVARDAEGKTMELIRTFLDPIRFP